MPRIEQIELQPRQSNFLDQQSLIEAVALLEQKDSKAGVIRHAGPFHFIRAAKTELERSGKTNSLVDSLDQQVDRLPLRVAITDSNRNLLAMAGLIGFNHSSEYIDSDRLIGALPVEITDRLKFVALRQQWQERSYPQSMVKEASKRSVGFGANIDLSDSLALQQTQICEAFLTLALISNLSLEGCDHKEILRQLPINPWPESSTKSAIRAMRRLITGARHLRPLIRSRGGYKTVFSLKSDWWERESFSKLLAITLYRRPSARESCVVFPLHSPRGSPTVVGERRETTIAALLKDMYEQTENLYTTEYRKREPRLLLKISDPNIYWLFFLMERSGLQTSLSSINEEHQVSAVKSIFDMWGSLRGSLMKISCQSEDTLEKLKTIQAVLARKGVYTFASELLITWSLRFDSERLQAYFLSTTIASQNQGRSSYKAIARRVHAQYPSVSQRTIDDWIRSEVGGPYELEDYCNCYGLDPDEARVLYICGGEAVLWQLRDRGYFLDMSLPDLARLILNHLPKELSFLEDIESLDQPRVDVETVARRIIAGEPPLIEVIQAVSQATDLSFGLGQVNKIMRMSDEEARQEIQRLVRKYVQRKDSNQKRKRNLILPVKKLTSV